MISIQIVPTGGGAGFACPGPAIPTPDANLTVIVTFSKPVTGITNCLGPGCGFPTCRNIRLFRCNNEENPCTTSFGEIIPTSSSYDPATNRATATFVTGNFSSPTAGFVQVGGNPDCPVGDGCGGSVEASCPVVFEVSA